MLVALWNGQPLSSIHLKEKKETPWYHAQTFYCPSCRQPVVLKVGELRVPHFAHRRQSDCTSDFSEGESIAHLLGKQQLFHFFQKACLHVELEKRLPQLQQRPDLFVYTAQQQWAIEFQCSRIPVADIERRTAGYVNYGIEPIWILQQKRTLSLSVQKMKLSNFEQQFIRHNTLLTYCPYAKQFTYYAHLLPVTKTQFFTVIHQMPLSQQTFPFAQIRPINEVQFQQYWQLLHYEKPMYIMNRIRYSKRGVQDLFLRAFYTLRLTPYTIPNFIGIPIDIHNELKESIIEWQLLLFAYCQQSGCEVTSIDEWHIRNFLKWMQIHITTKAIQVIQQYVMILRTCAIHTVKDQSENSLLFSVVYRQFIAFNFKN